MQRPHGYCVQFRGFYTVPVPGCSQPPEVPVLLPPGSASSRQASTAHLDLLDEPGWARMWQELLPLPLGSLARCSSLRGPGRLGRLVRGCCPHISPEAAAELTPHPLAAEAGPA